MKNLYGNVWVPDDGYQYVSNGTVWSTQIVLGAKDNISNWHDTNEEPPEPPEPPEPEATTEDYEEALNRLGVSE